MGHDRKNRHWGLLAGGVALAGGAIDPDGPADPDVQALVQPYIDVLGAQFDIVIGRSGGRWNRGTPILNDTSQTFKLATTNFLSTGGDGYTVLADPSFTSLGLLTAAIGDYVTAQGLVTPTFDCRMVDQNPAGPATTRAANPLGPFGTRADCP